MSTNELQGMSEEAWLMENFYNQYKRELSKFAA